MPTFSNLALQEPSTVSARVATVTVVRGSTSERQEILVLGDPESSIGLAQVLAAAPASTTYGLVVRQFDSTIANLSTGSVRVVQSSAVDLLATVTPVAGSTWAVRPLQSSAADLQVTATPLAGSTWAVRPLQSSAADLQVTATPVAGSTWNVRPLQSSAADLQATVTPAAGSTWIIRHGTSDSTSASSATNGSSGDHTIFSSAAAISFKIGAYALTMASTVLTRCRFLSGSTTELWRLVLQAPSSAALGANLAVPMPSWLFRTAVAAPLLLNLDAAVAVHVAVAAFKESS